MTRRGGFIGHDGLNAPDAPTGVSGTAGDTQVTVSWTAPSDVGGSAITGYNVQAADGSGTYRPPFDISSASYDSKSFDVSGQDTLNLGLAFSADGTKMYTTGVNTGNIYQYDLSTAWDVSTASYASKSLSVSSQDTVPRGILFNADGTSIYVCGDINAAIFQYDMTTAYDLSTASYASKSLSVSSEEPGPAGIAFNNDGTKIYVIGYNNDNVRQYALSTAYDVSTGSYESKTLDISSQDGSPRSLFFNSDGTKLFVNGNLTDTMYQYSLSSAYDVSTGSYDNVSFLYSAQADDASGVTFKPDGTKMYVCNFGSDQVVYQYSTQLTDYPAASPVTITGLTNGTSYTFNVWAINAFGWSSPSDASDGVSPTATGDRALLWYSDVAANIDYINIASTGNASDFGDSTKSDSSYGGACSSSTRAVHIGGTGSATNVMEYATIASLGNAVDFGDYTYAVNQNSAAANSTRGIMGLGYDQDGGGTNNDIKYITIATTGNASDFGDMTTSRYEGATISNTTRACFSRGYNGYNTIDYVTIASTGNATDFGDCQTNDYGAGGAGNSTRGLFAGGTGAGSADKIEYLTFASTGNTASFGDLTINMTQRTGGTANATRSVFVGGNGVNSGIDYVTTATLGNASAFGDLTDTSGSNVVGAACASNTHGGL